ncbi:MAG: apolipoprotein N-acyltransferase [Verrucomicrobiota bacterium]
MELSPFRGNLRQLKNLWANPLLRSRYPLAILAGLTLAASFPKIGIAGFAWIAPALMLVAAWGKTGWERFRIGYVAGLTHYLASLYWLLLIPYRWHGIPLGPALGWLALSAFIALYPATWVWVLGEVLSPKSKVQSREEESGSQRSEVKGQNSGGGWMLRTLWALSGAVLWVALEMIVARLFTGFPWNLFGASQWQLLPLIQISSITGVYGVAFIVVWTSLSLLSAALMIIQRPTMRSAWLGEIILPLAVLVIVFSFGFHQLAHDPSPTRTIKVTLVQPNIPQTVIWDASKDDERFRELVHLSEQALTNQTDLLIWPEASVPQLPLWEKDRKTFSALTNLAASHHVWLIVGADDAEPRLNSSRPNDADYYNSSFLISPDGRLREIYRKRALVIFGEYIPLIRWMPFFKWFTPIEGGFTSGDRAIPFLLPDLKVKTSVLICFEDIFPHLAREYAEDDTDFLVNITNNGWFGEGAAQWQHGTSALFRAVENGLPLVRCSNNGLTCWVDAHGRLRQLFHDRNDSVYGAGIMTAEIPLLDAGQRRTPTFYNQHGDWFGWGCVGLAAVMVVGRIVRGRNYFFRS